MRNRAHVMSFLLEKKAPRQHVTPVNERFDTLQNFHHGTNSLINDFLTRKRNPMDENQKTTKKQQQQLNDGGRYKGG